jgi:DNA primase
VDIRVLVMPGGRDPDEVIRADPAGWPRLVESALPVVEYVIQIVAAGHNLNDPKEKAAFSRQVVPVIRDVADPVERAHYAQRLARILRVDERTVLEELGAASPKARRPARPGESVAEHAGVLARSASDLEAHCLTALLQSSSALLQVDETLAAINLDPLGADDLDNTAHREILTAIREAGEQGMEVRECLDEMLWPVLTALIAAGTSRPALAETPDWGREAVQSALRLRERNLKRQQQELDVLAREAVEQGQADAARELGEHGHRCAIVINRLQKARWPGEIARLNTADPWRQS